jgi:hypothetical protein
VAKAVKKAKKAASTASAATAPPPAEGDPKKGAPPGGWLQWNQPSSTTWLAPDPEGDASKSGARISMSTRAWQGNPEPLYSVYRDGKYLGSDTSLEAAQQRAQYREQTRSAANDTLDGKPDGMPLALALTGDERAALRGGKGEHPCTAQARPRGTGASQGRTTAQGCRGCPASAQGSGGSPQAAARQDTRHGDHSRRDGH